ncbi:stimulated by retinoic acid gene 6 protein-like isoform X2 [Pantherophis guttatus]|uniref:Stimulated by retinoic acid gene 6 protein-like isoform X2 n=1 Tax=Pantherophis guttatus TaxID=94885 RepID=A0A6P9BFD7_PANGU|nr:stimulated by retinoic acid gene 6 protein-like isoform X2 [Pantherophis guttatus]
MADDEETPNTFQVNDTCKSSIEASVFLHYSLIPSVVIILILACLEKRTKRFWFDDKYPICPRRCGLLLPMDSDDSISNRWSLGFAYGATANKIMFLFEKEFFPEGLPEWAKVFWILLMAFEVGISSYPFFVCLLTKNEVVGAILGFLYTAAWAVITILDIVECPAEDEKNSFTEEHQLQYVQQLLRKPVLGNPQKNWFQRKLYQWDPYFKFPSRIISTIIVMFLCLYMFVMTEYIVVNLILKLLKAFLQDLRTNIPASENESWIQSIEEFIHIFEGIWIATTVIAFATCIGYAFNILVCYRKQIKLLRAGKKHLLVSESMKVSSSQCVVALSKFISFQVAYIMWGYLIMHLVQWSFGMIFTYILILPMIRGEWMELLNKWGTVILTFVIVLVIKKIQVLLGARFFLQPKMSPSDSQKPLALDNRRVFINFSYFLFFHSVVVGLTSCLMRLFRSIILGAWLVGRIDRAVMPKGFEQCDAGYTVWIGMLFLDHYHTNPILVCFCQILCDKLKEKTLFADSYSAVCKPLDPVPRVSSKARTRWFLLYTLLNNPSVQKIRKLKPLSYSAD